MKVSTVPIGTVKPNPGNPRRNADAVAKVAASLKEFGWRQPIVVDSKHVVVVGHTRLLAARSLGMAQLPVHMAEGLTAAQVRAYRLADNWTNEEAEWDEEFLAAELRLLEGEGDDLGLTGFDTDELGDRWRARRPTCPPGQSHARRSGPTRMRRSEADRSQHPSTLLACETLRRVAQRRNRRPLLRRRHHTLGAGHAADGGPWPREAQVGVRRRRRNRPHRPGRTRPMSSRACSTSRRDACSS